MLGAFTVLHYGNLRHHACLLPIHSRELKSESTSDVSYKYGSLLTICTKKSSNLLSQNEKEHDKYHLKKATLAKCTAVLDSFW